MTQDQAIDAGICPRCKKHPARPNKTLCTQCSRSHNERQIAARGHARCKHCGQTIRLCSICGQKGHRADTCDIHSKEARP